MNIKYIISLSALVALTATSCWGAAQDAIATPDQRITALPELPRTLFATLLEQMELHDLVTMAMTNPEFIDDIKYALNMEIHKLLTKHNGNLETALLDAADRNKPLAVSYLIQQGVNVNAQDIYGRTTLQWAAREGQNVITTQLIAARADINAKGPGGRTALQWAAINDDKPLVAQLIATRANVNAKDNFGHTALRWAVINNHGAIAAQLIAAGADYSDLTDDIKKQIEKWING